MYVIGTAGHVDHGKSTLVKALTDIDPDRLPEEKAREMTVDLGFAWMTLPSGREVSIVDVPGHERFIKNMLAGVGAIDLAMLIVAADESVMPQTREHLAILDILHIRRSLVVITKTDLVDEEMVELVKAEVEDALEGTSFQGCPMVGVSAYTGDGLDDLSSALDQILDNTEERADLGRPRLPVDRCFSITGFGTVVTGTLIDGVLAVGQEVELAGSGQRGRIRGLQSHKNKVDHTQPGVRLAVNISGLSRDDVERGDVLTNPGWLRPTRRLDAKIRMVKGAPHSLRHNQGVTFHLLSSEATARVRLLDADRLAPGAEGWVQILLDEPMPMVKGDFFVVRSAEDTLGGGQVVDPTPRRRHRRFNPDVVERLMMLDEGTGEDILLTVAEQWGPCDLTSLSLRSNLSESEVLERIPSLSQ
ncbi:MAG TPA: selenocysteine-specific translation elongation factor, partial [Dehalococcoidia bacterium]|nr:selenocysteine-specific translation elongation factor [Dehalococcoidia bacterium]